MNRSLTGRGVLFWVVGFFAFVIAVNVYFIVMSVKTFSGEDEQKPYLQGVEYNQTLARRAEQEKLAWRATITANRIEAGKIRIMVALKRPDGLPQTGLMLHGELRHPMNQNRDRPLELKEISAGLYQTDVTGVTTGSWDVVVETGGNAIPFELSRRLWLR